MSMHRFNRPGLLAMILAALVTSAACKPTTPASRPIGSLAVAMSAPGTRTSTVPSSVTVSHQAATLAQPIVTNGSQPAGIVTAGSTLSGSAPPPGTCHVHLAADGQPLPDPGCTPGAVDAAVSQANIGTTICRTGYTATVRPPVAATDAFKARDELAYSIHGGELDHLIPLELGGSSDARNLWVEPGSIPNPKDTVENALHDAVCGGRVQLMAAQRVIALDWTTALAKIGQTGASTTATTTATAAPVGTTNAYVTPGAFCSTASATGVSKAGTAMVCKTTTTDSRLRWRAA